MKIALASDLHQEFLRDREFGLDPNTRFHLGDLPTDVDLTIIAGDLDVTLADSLRRIGAELPGRETVYVAGNHDYYNRGEGSPQTMDEILAEGRQLARELGIHFLENDAVEVGGIRVLGCTLWTDMESVGRGHKASKMNEAGGSKGMNDYRAMKRWSTKTPGKRKPARPRETVAMHAASRAFLERELAVPFMGQTVVVTHHAPHPDSLDPRYSSLNWCYASNLASLMDEASAPDLWLHGHIHVARDYVVGSTRIVANPRGYLFGRDNDIGNGFQPNMVIEMDTLDYKPPGM